MSLLFFIRFSSILNKNKTQFWSITLNISSAFYITETLSSPFSLSLYFLFIYSKVIFLITQFNEKDKSVFIFVTLLFLFILWSAVKYTTLGIQVTN